MMDDEWLHYLRRLRTEGYLDASAGRPMCHGALPGREERFEYCKGYEDWQERNLPGYQRWTPSTDAANPLGRAHVRIQATKITPWRG